MTLDAFFRMAEDDEVRAIAELDAHPEIVSAIEVAGDWQDGRPAPAVVHAAHRGMHRLVAALLAAGADIRGRGLGGGTALHFAARGGHRETVQVLIDRGAPVDVRCEAFGATPLGWAADGFGPDGTFPKREHVGAAGLLLAAGADPELRNNAGNRPVDLVQDPPGNPMKRMLERR